MVVFGRRCRPSTTATSAVSICGNVQVRLIAQAEAEANQAKDEYANLLKGNDHRATVQQICNYYDEFLGWANEFYLASVPRKRAILVELLEKVEVGRGYKVTIYIRENYQQLLKLGKTVKNNGI